MAKYGKLAQKKVQENIHEMKEGKLRMGKSRKKVRSRKQAVAIALAETRAEGGKAPEEPKNRKK